MLWAYETLYATITPRRPRAPTAGFVRALSSSTERRESRPRSAIIFHELSSDVRPTLSGAR